ncbi:TetR family transcriptional regulator [Roseibium hamelinense]|uniref:TetR family transcriptional regulator n=1 Tax=Roseibium hamelinense TaxID=150831 RepID=A0A562THH3_9HYPH|nr:TetR/AcrR family transcriptional regulator [Roseibium hamelinense]MTI45795.1 TetR/AcrR family transcriptional regulator [Roseibium hamelinense]TWI93022.1 TetR family transcriptional regulator [Roseibium hamelinense]
MPRGLEFDLETARAAIMQVFWTRGYEATSLSDLERATSLVRTSLYNSFGKKPEMFLDSLKLYHETIENQIESITQGRGSEALVDVISAMMEGSDKPSQQPAGCLMVMSATQSKTIEPRHLQIVKDYRQMLVRKAERVLKRDKQSERLARHVDPEEAAEFLICVVWGALAAQCLSAERNTAAAGAKMLKETIKNWLID